VLRVSSSTFTFRIDFRSFLDAFLFTNYLRRCHQSFVEERNSLYTKLTKNVDMLFNTRYFATYDQTLLTILEQRNAVEPGQSFIHSLKLDLLTVTLEEILVGAFALPKTQLDMVKEIVFYIDFMMIERMQFMLRGEVASSLTEQLLSALMAHQEILNKFSIIDKRLEVICQFLVLIHKKVLFNELTHDLCNILNRMSPSFRHREENVKEVRPLTAFIAVIRRFLDQFAVFKEQISFNVTLLDAFRKFYYHFFGYFRFLFERRIIDFEFENAVDMLEELNLMVRETDRIVSEANIKFAKFMGTVPELTFFKRLVAPISSRLYLIIRKRIKETVVGALRSYDFSQFNLVDIVTIHLSQVHEKINGTSVNTSLALLKLFWGRLSRPPWSDSPGMKRGRKTLPCLRKQSLK
jgi:hypothetical protein